MVRGVSIEKFLLVKWLNASLAINRRFQDYIGSSCGFWRRALMRSYPAIPVTARITSMSKIIHGHGFVPMSPGRAKTNAEHRAQAGYVALYPQLTKK